MADSREKRLTTTEVTPAIGRRHPGPGRATMPPSNRYPTTVREGTVYIEADVGRIEIGPLETILDLVGGPAWTIRYDDWERARYDLDTSDEGLTVDVVDTIEAMTFGSSFVTTLKAQPAEAPDDESVSPRLGLFVGRLLENLEYGVR